MKARSEGTSLSSCHWVLTGREPSGGSKPANAPSVRFVWSSVQAYSEPSCPRLPHRHHLTRLRAPPNDVVTRSHHRHALPPKSRAHAPSGRSGRARDAADRGNAEPAGELSPSALLLTSFMTGCPPPVQAPDMIAVWPYRTRSAYPLIA